jgi:hypothetical protein
MLHIKTRIIPHRPNTVLVFVEHGGVEYRLVFCDNKPSLAEKVLAEDSYRGRASTNTRIVKGPKAVWTFAAQHLTPSQ